MGVECGFLIGEENLTPTGVAAPKAFPIVDPVHLRHDRGVEGLETIEFSITQILDDPGLDDVDAFFHVSLIPWFDRSSRGYPEAEVLTEPEVVLIDVADTHAFKQLIGGS